MRYGWLRTLAVSCAFGLMVVFAGRASAQDAAAPVPKERSFMSPRLYGVGQLGLFGDVHAHGAVTGTNGLEPGGGLALGFEIPVVDVFSLGGELGMWGWNSNAGTAYDVGNSFLADFDIVPRLRMPFLDGAGAHGAIGLAMPVGPTVSVVSQQERSALAVQGATSDTGAGLNAGLLAYAQYFVVPGFGFSVEGGYQHHFMWHDTLGSLGQSQHVQLDMGQLVLRAGLIVALR